MVRSLNPLLLVLTCLLPPHDAHAAYFRCHVPMLAELGKQAKDTFSFPVDPSLKEMQQKAMVAKFPFDSVTESSVKVKNTPIELWWNLREGSLPVHSSIQGTNSVSKTLNGVGAIDDLHVGLRRQPRCFQPSPKV